MATYTLVSRFGLLLIATVLGCLPAGFFLVLTGAFLLREDPARYAVGLLGGFAFSLLFSGVAFHFSRQIYEIALSDDGTVELRRTIGATRIAARDIHEFEGESSRDYDGSHTVWKLSLRSSAGTFRFGEFPNVLDFVERVRTHHPGVRIVGRWPISAPWEPSPPRRADDRSLAGVGPARTIPDVAAPAMSSYTVQPVEGSFIKAVACFGFGVLIFSIFAGPVIWGDRTD